MKMKRFMALFIVLAVVVVGLVGCSQPADTAADGSGQAAEQPAEQETEAAGDSAAEEPAQSDEGAEAPAEGDADSKFVGVAFPSTLVDRWVSESTYVKEGLEELGYRAEIQYANDDSDLQIKQCENFLSQEVDMIVICAVDTTAAATVVEKAHQDGIPVVAYCRLIENADIDAFVAEDNQMVGTLQGQYIVDNVESGNIIVIGGSPSDSNGILYHDTGVAAMQEKIDSGDYTVVADQFCDGWQPPVAMSHVENALTQAENDVAAVLCPNDGLAGGAVEALAAQQLAGSVVVTGGDGELAAAKRILEGTQSMTVFKDPVAIAGSAVKAIDALLKGETPEYNSTLDNGFKEVDAVLVDMVVVTKDNLQSVWIDSGYFTEEELQG